MTGKEKKSTNTDNKSSEKVFRPSKIEYKVVQNNSPFRKSKVKTKEVTDFQRNDK